MYFCARLSEENDEEKRKMRENTCTNLEEEIGLALYPCTQVVEKGVKACTPENKFFAPRAVVPTALRDHIALSCFVIASKEWPIIVKPVLRT